MRQPTDLEARAYDEWYDRHRWAYETELAAIRPLLPSGDRAVEVGVGTGRFASRLGLRGGVEPARAMARVARRRGVEVVQGVAEHLPFASGRLECVLMVTTLCSVPNPAAALREAARVLGPGGVVVVADVDPDSFLGRLYEALRATGTFLRDARFRPVRDIRVWLRAAGFAEPRVRQTLFHAPADVTAVEPAREGHGEGGFVVVAAARRRAP